MRSEIIKRYKTSLILFGAALICGALFLLSGYHIRVGEPMDCFSGCFYKTSTTWTWVTFGFGGLGLLSAVAAVVSGIVAAKEQRKYWLLAVSIIVIALVCWYRQANL